MNDELFNKILKRVKIIAPQLTFEDESFRIFIEDAYLQVQKDGFDEDTAIVATSYLATHLAFIASNKNSKVKKEQADVLSREYFASGGTDDYLDEYNRLKKEIIGENIGEFY
jgi:hypothetical protein